MCIGVEDKGVEDEGMGVGVKAKGEGEGDGTAGAVRGGEGTVGSHIPKKIACMGKGVGEGRARGKLTNKWKSRGDGNTRTMGWETN